MMVKKSRTWDQELDLVNNHLDHNAKTISRIERMLESLAFTGFDPEGEVVKLHKRNLKSAKDRRLALEGRKEVVETALSEIMVLHKKGRGLECKPE